MTSLPGAVRKVVPEPLRERGRLLVAASLERRQRAAPTVRGAAIVFHAVAPAPGDPELELEPALAVKRLDEIVEYLSRRYLLVRAAELPAAARARRPGEPVPIALTFDDDLPAHRDHALPVFERHGAVATAFLCGSRRPFWWQLLQLAIDQLAIGPDDLPGIDRVSLTAALERQPGAIARVAKTIEDLAPERREAVGHVLASAVDAPPPLLGPDGASALGAAGWELGSHTRGHHLLTGLDAGQLAGELARRHVDASGTLPRTLAYPHGKAGRREAEAARRAGYEAAFTGYSSVLTEGTDDFLIGRLQPGSSTIGRFALDVARAIATA